MTVEPFDVFVRRVAPEHSGLILAEVERLREALALVNSIGAETIVEQRDEARAKVEQLREACAAAYSQLTDGEGLGPDTSEDAVEDARRTLADAIVMAKPPPSDVTAQPSDETSP